MTNKVDTTILWPPIIYAYILIPLSAIASNYLSIMMTIIAMIPLMAIFVIWLIWAVRRAVNNKKENTDGKQS